jgi:hypothetical protein
MGFYLSLALFRGLAASLTAQTFRGETTGSNEDASGAAKPGFPEEPAPGTLGNLGRNAIFGPGFFTSDPSMFREFAIGEPVRAPTTTCNSGSFGSIGNTRNRSGARGPGAGESSNVQLALKFVR